MSLVLKVKIGWHS